ncbi:MAG: hypothetical protein M1814_006672 [Vezdaea aestivalis]|nr:MAG: hypothetical protein M1814_006672 [Vezdaea aestivalis]
MSAPLNEKEIVTNDHHTSKDVEKSTTGVDYEIAEAVVKDGIKVHPQPTRDPLDPLNWPTWRKYSIVAIVMIKYMLFTYITTTTVPSIVELGEIFQVDNNKLNWTIAIPALGLAVGPLFWSSFADIYGRRIIFIIGTVIALAATIGAAKADVYGNYMAARFFQGFGVSPAATVGLAIINDLFFDTQRGLAIGLWTLSIDTGLLIGPLVGGFIDLVSPEWVQWLTAIFFGVLLVLELAFMPETLYPRNQMLSRLPLEEHVDFGVSAEKVKLASASDVELPRTKQLFFLNVKPVPGMRHPKPWDSLVRFLLTFKFPAVVIAVCGYCFLWYWWILTLITEIPFAYPQYKPNIQGLLFIGLLLGTLFAEVFLSGWLSDLIVLRLAKRNNGVKVAEMRLWLVYPAVLFSAIGLILWGISIDKAYHWIVGQIAFFLFAAGIQMGNTAICSYIVDAYPLNSMSVITFYAVMINLSAFISPVSLNTFLE